MNQNKIIRSICYFCENPNDQILNRIEVISHALTGQDFTIQTKRFCTKTKEIKNLEDKINKDYYLSIGTLSFEEILTKLNEFYLSKNIFFNLELSSIPIQIKHVNLLFEIIKNKNDKTFNFTYVFNNRTSSPFFPSASYNQKGFSIGLQLTDLSEDCKTLDEWLENIKKILFEVFNLFKGEPDFLGIDSSIAPAFEGKSSLVNFINKCGMTFSKSTTTETYLKITKFIKEQNPKPVGLCGLMLPCLEDFELAKEYEKGNFSIERNLFLSLNSGLGIDTYPIGVDEKQEDLLNILLLVQGLSNKYNKPLSVRFVSDGKAKVGEKTDFQNQYLKDVVIKKI